MVAKGGDEFCTLRNPAIGQLSCDLLHVERDSPVLYLPAAFAFGDDRVSGARVPVLGQAGRRHVGEQLAAPRSNVGNVQVTEGNRRRAADLLGISRSTLYRMLTRYGLAEDSGRRQRPVISVGNL